MSPTPRPHLTLERLLLADAASGLGSFALLLGATPALAAWTGLGEPLLRMAALLLVPSAAIMIAAARIASLTIPLGWVVVAGNALWVLASLGLVLSLQLTLAGHALVLLQAAFVAGIATLEARALLARQTPAAAHG